MSAGAARPDVARQNELLEGIDADSAAALQRWLHPFAAAPGELLFTHGTPIDRVLILGAGAVELGAPVSDVVGPGAVLGEPALNGPAVHAADARCVEPVEGLFIDVPEFDQQRSYGTPLAAAVLRRLAVLLCRRVRAREAAQPAVSETRTPELTAGPGAQELVPLMSGLRFFAGFTGTELERFAAEARAWHLEPGALLFAEGTTARSAFIVLRGAMDVSRQRPDRAVRLATVGPGRMLGDLSLIDGGPRTATVTCSADEPGLVVELDADLLRRQLDDGSSAGMTLLQEVNRGLFRVLAQNDARRMATAARSGGPVEAERGALIDRVRASLIGDDAVIEGPFGDRRIVYADYTASGRSLTFIEDFIRREVLPLYANTHTEASATGLQTTHLREDARRLIHRSVGGTDEDVVIFTGSGATGAIDKLAQIVGLKLNSALEDRHHLAEHIAAADRPVVFVGPFEHHSNELVWREGVADVVSILEDADGRVDLEHLEAELVRYADRPFKLGSFSAASNVTGILTDTEAVAILLHRYGALSCWDYAAAGPYLRIDMNPQPDLPHGHLAYKDAVFLSPHKFPGGPGTPGVLVVKRAVVENRVPTVPSGGTIVFVTPRSQSYHPEPSVREEGGTPAIVESIRAGLVFALKDAVGPAEIQRREEEFVGRALSSWQANPRILILGNPDLPRLSIVSLAFRHRVGDVHEDALLHSNFAASLLNDLFGIQSRSGCFCAGPYVHRMYGINDVWSRRMDGEATLGHLGAKLSFVRLNFNYFLSETIFQYIVEAIHFIADHGWKFLPQYTFDPFSGLWHHEDGPSRPPLSLHDVSFESGVMEFQGPRASAPESMLADHLRRAHELVAEIDAHPRERPTYEPVLSPEFDRIRWFPLPREAQAELDGRLSSL